MSKGSSEVSPIVIGAEMRRVWRALNPSGLSAQNEFSDWFNPTSLKEDHVVGITLARNKVENTRVVYGDAVAYTGGKKGPKKTYQGLRRDVLEAVVEVEIEGAGDVPVLRLTTEMPHDRGRATVEPPAVPSPDLELRVFTEDEAFIVAREGLDRLFSARS